MMHSIDLKFGMYIIGHRQRNTIDFGEYRMHSFFFRSTKKNSYTLLLIESNPLKGSSIQTVHWIELKFGMHIISYLLRRKPKFDAWFLEIFHFVGN